MGAPVVPLYPGANEAEDQQHEGATVAAVFQIEIGAHRANGTNHITDGVGNTQPHRRDGVGNRVRLGGTSTRTAPS